MQIQCPCGDVISTVTVPHPLGFLLIPETVLDAMETELRQEVAVSALIDRIDGASIQVYRCPSCHGLVAFEEGRGVAATFYARKNFLAGPPTTP